MGTFVKPRVCRQECTKLFFLILSNALKEFILICVSRDEAKWRCRLQWIQKKEHGDIQQQMSVAIGPLTGTVTIKTSLKERRGKIHKPKLATENTCEEKRNETLVLFTSESLIKKLHYCKCGSHLHRRTQRTMGKLCNTEAVNSGYIWAQSR
jgi:hypothetical protein